MRDHVMRVSQVLPKLSEEQIENILNSITAENEMLDSVLDSLVTGIMVVDEKWNLLKVNKTAERYLSRPVLGDKVNSESAFELIGEEEIAAFIKNCALEDKSNVSEEFSISNSDGSVRFVTVSVFSWVCRCKMRGRILKFNDITEKRSQEVLLRRMENMAGLTNLAAGMAHEIKNPLGAIGIHIQLIQRAVKKEREKKGLLPDKKFLEDHLDVVNEEIENLNKLVMDFLFAVRPINARLTLVNPSKLIENIVSFFSPEFEREGVSFSFKGEAASSRLMIDEKLFREALINIVQNCFSAVKERYNDFYSGSDSENSSGKKKSGGCAGKIEISSSEKDARYEIRISDNGTGMSEEVLSHIFEPYYTTKASGTGLGMTMVYKIIKEFSGDINVKSEPGKGTQFTIMIPIPQTSRKLLLKPDEAK